MLTKEQFKEALAAQDILIDFDVVEPKEPEHDTDPNTIIELKNVRQYFPMGYGKNRLYVKAVHNVSFKVYKGEVFGLVGESGCGKTTTGRSIIKLYNITDGQIWYKGNLISQGTRTFKQNIQKARQSIKDKKKEVAAAIKELKAAMELQNENADAVSELQELVSELNIRLKEYITSQKAIIKSQKENISKSSVINKRNPELMNHMQMIFQDPIDSLDPRLTVDEIISEGMVINSKYVKKANRIKAREAKKARQLEIKEAKKAGTYVEEEFEAKELEANVEPENKLSQKDEMHKKVEDALKLVGLLPDHASRYPHEFSGGQRQRIGIARALVVNPDVIIADEPISALDVSIQAQVINLLNDIRNDFGLTIIFIAHNLSVVRFFCDKIAVMYYGRIVEIAESEELFAHPLHPYTKSLLSAVPLPDPDYELKRERIFYNPSLRPYTDDKPQMVEIRPGHFISGSKNEIERYEKELNGEPFDPDPTLGVSHK